MLDKLKNLMGFNAVEPEGTVWYRCNNANCDVWTDDDGTKHYVKELEYCEESSGCVYDSCSCS